LAGCQSVFFYPNDFEYAAADKLRPAPESITFAAEDGTPLHGWYFHAPGRPKGRIVQFHGNAQNLTAHFRFLRHAARAGYDHFVFDYRGYGKSPGVPTPARAVADGRAALRWLAARNSAGAKPLPLIVLGQSLGGAVALRALADLQGEVSVRLLVLDSTFASYRSAARGVVAQSWLTWWLQPVAWSIVDNSAAPPRDLSKIGVGRTLVVHGELDRTIPARLGRAVFERLPEPKEFWLVPGGTHTDFLWRVDYEAKFYAALDQATGA